MECANYYPDRTCLFDPERRTGCAAMQARSIHPNRTCLFDLERKKEGADMQFPRRLRKPRKRNGASFF